jgi:putative membrane protein
MNQSDEAIDERPASEGFWLRIIYIVSAAICLVVAFLILGPRPEGLSGQLDVSTLPLVNCILNGTTAALLCIALLLIKRGHIEAHKKTMLAAFGTSTLFLVSYVLYHLFKPGPRLYQGDLKTLYYAILISHILLAVVILPLALVTLYRGWTMQVERHRAIARVTFPLWLYVSATGIVIYVMLYG